MRFFVRPSCMAVLAAVSYLLSPAMLSAQQTTATAAATTASASADATSSSLGLPAKDPVLSGDETPVVTKHTLFAGGTTITYTATCGLMPLKNEAGDVEARIFFMAYTVDKPTTAPARPLMFSFNGGPGSSSVWLHLGALGPRRAAMLDDGSMPAPPFRLEDNPNSWLPETDLVFIDPVGTGFSRPAKPENGKKYWNVNGDIESVGDFIRLYITRYQRWNSPLFLVGESYGTTRAAGLAGHLGERGVALNGVILVSTVLQFQTLSFDKSNDLPYNLFLPTYTASAWFHKRLPQDLQAKPLLDVMDEARQFAGTAYTLLLQRGDEQTTAQRAEAARTVARYTGLDAAYVERSRLRIYIQRFCKELLRDRNQTVGRFDSRYLGTDETELGDFPEYDPSYTAVRPPYTALFNHYLRTELAYKTDAEYHILRGVSWDWGNGRDGYPDTSEALRQALARNPYLRVLVCAGYYDLATPFYATEYTLAHMGLSPEQRSRIRVQYYEAGHMMYLHMPSLLKLTQDVRAFMKESLKN